MKLTLDELSNEQWDQVKDVLNSEPNKRHSGSKGEYYGQYFKVHAKPLVDFSPWTGESKIDGYKNVRFEDVYNGIRDDSEFAFRRKQEHLQVRQKLSSLVTKFLME